GRRVPPGRGRALHRHVLGDPGRDGREVRDLPVRPAAPGRPDARCELRPGGVRLAAGAVFHWLHPGHGHTANPYGVGGRAAPRRSDRHRRTVQAFPFDNTGGDGSMNTAKIPVPDILVLLPGITGSVLTKDGKPVWAPSPGAALRALLSLGKSIKELEV